MRILDCKSPVCQDLVREAPRILDFLCEDCETAFAALQADLDALRVAYTIDPGIVRGLDYYTKTAFEFVSDRIGAQGTVCGGGRYDGLVQELGGPPTPGVGFGLGIERLLLLMEAAGAAIPPPAGADVFVACMGAAARAAGLRLLRQLRGAGLWAEIDLLDRTIKNQFKYADRLNARYAAVIGEDELQEGSVTLKDMGSGAQRRISADDLPRILLEDVRAAGREKTDGE
jgi:histidyl-tRNA synthetase